jgi:hypothetical protein
MKSRLLFFVGFLFMCFANKVFATKGLAIKLEVTNAAQNLINNNIRIPAGMKAKQANHHVTIGYIEKNLPDSQMDQLGRQLTQELQRMYTTAIILEVEKADQPFRNNVIALIPSNKTINDLKNINIFVNNIITKYHHQLNNLTQPHNYMPHMTISTRPTYLKFLQGLNNSISILKTNNNGKLLFQLCNFTYTVMK